MDVQQAWMRAIWQGCAEVTKVDRGHAEAGTSLPTGDQPRTWLIRYVRTALIIHPGMRLLVGSDSGYTMAGHP